MKLKIIILFLATLNSILCIESSDFCILKQNEQECHWITALNVNQVFALETTFHVQNTYK
jgi:hypothetical protein